MRLNVQRGIEYVQQKPESVRIRYVVGCVAVVMLLVIGVWSLSVSDSFRSLSQGAGTLTEGAKGVIPKATDFSLDTVLSGGKSFEERKREVSGEAFFQKQLEDKKTPNFEQDGYGPKSKDDSTSTVPDQTDTSGSLLQLYPR